MSRGRGRPKAEVVLVDLGHVSVPCEVAEAVNALVGSSGGVSKTTFVRQALLVGLQTLGVIPSDSVAAVPTTPYERKNR